MSLTAVIYTTYLALVLCVNFCSCAPTVYEYNPCGNHDDEVYAGGKCFRMFLEAVWWADAKSRCRSSSPGAQLAEPDSLEQMETLAELMRRTATERSQLKSFLGGVVHHVESGAAVWDYKGLLFLCLTSSRYIHGSETRLKNIKLIF